MYIRTSGNGSCHSRKSPFPNHFRSRIVLTWSENSRESASSREPTQPNAKGRLRILSSSASLPMRWRRLGTCRASLEDHELTPHPFRPILEPEDTRVGLIESVGEISQQRGAFPVGEAGRAIAVGFTNRHDRKRDRSEPLSGRERYCRSILTASCQQQRAWQDR